MALTLPGAPWDGHDTRFYRVRDPIIGADTAQPDAHWQALVTGYNLALATLHAGAIASDSWADGQGAGLDSAIHEVRLQYVIPPQPSDRHSAVRVVVEVENADGSVRISTAAGADVETVAVVGTQTVDEVLTVSTAVDGRDRLQIETKGEVDLLSVEISWEPISAAGWPAADSTLADTDFDGIDPFDDDDFDYGELLSSGRMLTLHEAQAHLADRRRGLLSTAAIAGAVTGPGRFICRPIRRVVPVPYRGVDVLGRVLVANPTGADLNLWVQLGAGAASDVVDRRARARVQQVVIDAGAALGWKDFTGRLRDDREFRAPPELSGWTQIGLYPEDGLELHSAAIWETP